MNLSGIKQNQKLQADCFINLLLKDNVKVEKVAFS